MGARKGKSGPNATNDKVNSGPSQQGRGEAFWGGVIHWSSSLAGELPEELDEVESSLADTSTQLDSNDVFFGSVQSDIVGVQYYKGTVSNNELVILEREPHNKYDQNAVKVENTGLEQVGHIKREHAKVFAYIMDNKFAKIEGIIPYGANNRFRIPVDIQFWGAQEMKIKVHDYLKSHGMTVQASETRKSGGGMMPGPSSLPGKLAVDYGHVVSSRTKVTPQEMENELDKMFETLDEGDKTTEIEPDKAIARKMYPHQKQALNWMIRKENKDDLPPFWEKQNNFYVNTLTRYMTSARPNSVHGGILADDMGLGKTLEMISLIMTNFVDGKSLAHPLSGRFRAPFGFTGKMSQKSVSCRGGSGINKSQGKSESADLTLPHSTARAKEFSSPRLVLPKTSTKAVQSVAEKSSENCDEGLATVMLKKEDPEYRPASLESSDVMQASVTRPRRSRKRPARYSFDDDEEEDDNKEKYQPPSKSGRKGKQQNRLQPSDMIVLCGDSDEKIREQQQSSSSSTEPEGKILPDTAKNGICGLIPDITQALPSAVTNANDSGNTVRKTEFCPGGNSSSQPAIDVDDLSDPQIPIIIGDSDDDLPDIPASNSKEDTTVDSNSLPPGCDSSTGRSWTAGPRGTLIICPLSVIGNWVEQFEEHVDKRVHLQLHVYYGSNRSKDISFLKDQDVVITTYSVLASDAKTLKSPLHKIEWLRIVLDEGHMIRNPNAKQSKAIYELRAERRWVLTGTPIQNSMKDLWSLINFLKVKPFTEKRWWNRTIALPLARREKPALQRVAHLMANLALRRTKNQQLHGKPLVELPARQVFLEKITLSQEEREVYEAMQKEGKVIIGRYFRQGTLLHHYGQVLAILLRLRQLCCHPRLIANAVKKMMQGNPAAAFEDLVPQGQQPAGAEAAESPELSEEDRQKLIDQLMAVISSGSDEECSICLDSLKDAVITACAHIYCRGCIMPVLVQPQPTCPLCRRSLDRMKFIDVGHEAGQSMSDKAETEVDSEEWQSSAKVDALMKSLNELRRQDPTVKSVIVSQFTSLLTVLETPLTMQGFVFSRLDGSMNVNERLRAVKEFSDPRQGSPTIFLLSLKAGGVGINLTSASRVFLMDPAWNPAAEDQCFDRCHRLGQTKDVIITRFVIEDSVEERMLELQDKKRQLMQGAFARKKPTADERRANLISDIKRLINL